MRIFLVVALVLAAGGARAQRVSAVDGNKLLGYCTAKSTTGCDAYLSGVADAIEAEGRERAPACIPVAVTGTQLRDVVAKYLRDHADTRQNHAGKLTIQAFAAAFPCRK